MCSLIGNVGFIADVTYFHYSIVVFNIHPPFQSTIISTGRKRGQVSLPLPRHKKICWSVPVCASLCQFVPVCAGLCHFVPFCAVLCHSPVSFRSSNSRSSPNCYPVYCNIVHKHKECHSGEWPSPSFIAAWPTAAAVGTPSNGLLLPVSPGERLPTRKAARRQ